MSYTSELLNACYYGDELPVDWEEKIKDHPGIKAFIHRALDLSAKALFFEHGARSGLREPE